MAALRIHHREVERWATAVNEFEKAANVQTKDRVACCCGALADSTH